MNEDHKGPTDQELKDQLQQEVQSDELFDKLAKMGGPVNNFGKAGNMQKREERPTTDQIVGGN